MGLIFPPHPPPNGDVMRDVVSRRRPILSFFFEVVLYRPGLLASSSRCEVASDTSRPLPLFFRVETSHTRST
jgi:hypothetical protein